MHEAHKLFGALDWSDLFQARFPIPFILFKVLFFGGLVAGEVCEENTVRTYVKLTEKEQNDGELWGERERDLLKNTISYSVSKYL